jgi:hypothetical protein
LGFLARNLGWFKIIYLVAALAYLAVAVYWGRHDMFRMHREYRQVSARLTGDYALLTAGREVANGCRQAVGGESNPGFGECLRRAESLVVQRAAVIKRQLQLEKHRATRKLAIFYTLLVLMLTLPVAGLYALLRTILYICTGISFDQDQSD